MKKENKGRREERNENPFPNPKPQGVCMYNVEGADIRFFKIIHTKI